MFAEEWYFGPRAAPERLRNAASPTGHGMSGQIGVEHPEPTTLSLSHLRFRVFETFAGAFDARSHMRRIRHRSRSRRSDLRARRAFPEKRKWSG